MKRDDPSAAIMCLQSALRADPTDKYVGILYKSLCIRFLVKKIYTIVRSLGVILRLQSLTVFIVKSNYVGIHILHCPNVF